MSSYTSDLATGKSSSTPIPLQIPQPLQTVTEQTTEAPTTASQVDNSAQPGHSFGKIGVHYGQAPAIQPKLTVGPVNDQYEQEADHVAAQVVGQVNSPTTQRQEMPEEEEELQTKPLADGVQRQATPEDEEELQTKLIENSIQRQEVPEEEEEIQTKALASTVQRQEMPEEEEQLQTKSLADSIQRQETPEEEEELQTKRLANTLQRQEEPEAEELQTKPQIQRRADGSMAATPALEGAIQQARGSGQALSDDTRQPMERAFGADFSRVKVHTDAQADQLNRSIQARAFTTGQDIFFRQGEHSPGTRAGQELLAHELTHVVQQNGKTVQRIQRQAASSLERDRLMKGEADALVADSSASRMHQSNNTGLPDPLKAGIEDLSATAMDDVKVHYNSDKPAELQALAYTQGTDIHVGPGQERHLPHEAWHVVQQKQERVKPTSQAKGVAINDDRGLEKEADDMGEKAIQMQSVFSPEEEYSIPRPMTQQKPLKHEIKPYSPRNMLLGTQQSTAPVQMFNVGWVPSNPGKWRATTTIAGNTPATKGGGAFVCGTVEANNIVQAGTAAKKVTIPAKHMLSDVSGAHMPTYQQARDLTPECDHIVETQEGGANDYTNARMITKAENNVPGTPRPVTPAYGGNIANVDLKIYTPVTIGVTKKYGGPHGLNTGDVLTLPQTRALARHANGVDPMKWNQVDRQVVNEIIGDGLGTQSGITLT